MSDLLRSLRGRLLVYTIGTGLNGIAGAALVPFYMRHLSPGDYGKVALAEAMTSICLVLLGLGLPSVFAASYGALRARGRRRFVGAIFMMVVAWTLLVEVLFLSAGSVWLKRLVPSLTDTYLLAVAGITAVEACALPLVLLCRTEGLARRYVTCSVVQVAISTGIPLVLIGRYGADASTILLGRLLGACGGIALLLPLLRGRAPHWSPRLGLPSVKAGVLLLPAGVCAVWLAVAPRYVLELASSTSAVGTFAFASKVAGVVNLLVVQPVALSWMPAILRARQSPTGGEMLGALAGHYIVGSLGVALSVACVGSVALETLRLDVAGVGRGLLVPLCLANALSGLVHPLNVGPYASNRPHRQLMPFIVAALTTTPLYIPLVRGYGVVGAAVGLCIAYGLLAALLFWTSQVSYRIAIPWRRVGGAVLGLLASFATAWWVGALLPASVATVVWSLGFGLSALVVVGLYAHRSSCQSDWRWTPS